MAELEKHSESADLRQGSLLTPYGIVPCIIAELCCKFNQNPLIKHTSTDNCWKTAFPQQNLCSRVAWSCDPACAVLLTIMSVNITWLSYSASLWRPLITPMWHCQKCSILHFPVLRLKSEPDQPQNLYIYSLYHCRAILIISSKSVENLFE